MAIMKKAEDDVALGALHKLRAQIAFARGKKEMAQKQFAHAIETLEKTGVQFELAAALVAAGQCEVFDGRRRLTFLFRAEEFYADSRIHNCIQQIGALIEQIGTGTKPVAAGEPAPDDDLEYITESDDIRKFIKHLPQIGQSDLPLLLTGETGVGKERMARYFHSITRPTGPFVAVNCASVPETLLESELFGYCRGAFTGADSDKPGLFASANGGVLLLDEIGEMPLALQAKLLGVLERRKTMPLGSTKEVDLDIKLIAATNCDLEEAVEEGRFRRDLYYRLSGISFCLPPLRERKEDIPVLLTRFLRESNLLSADDKPPPELLRQFVRYDWPGNVRELHNKVKKLEVMASLAVEGDLVELSRSVLSLGKAPVEQSLVDRVEQFERRLINEAMIAAGGNKSQAARMLGIHEATVRTKLKRYGISMGERIAS
jgi:transcriptional regulator with PAS, ATPase and Fis domain